MTLLPLRAAPVDAGWLAEISRSGRTVSRPEYASEGGWHLSASASRGVRHALAGRSLPRLSGRGCKAFVTKPG